jgi:hypothetical protein
MKKILFFLLISIKSFSQGSVKISDMPAATSLTGTEIVPIVQGGVNKKATVSLWPNNTIVVSSNTTAVNDGVYTVVASATFTDPSPVEGKGFTIFIRNGTGTVGGTGYSVAGTKIIRIFHSGSWANYVGGGAIFGLTPGQVTFATSGTAIGGDGGLFWDNASKNLGVGTSSPDASYKMHILGSDGVLLEATAGTNIVTRFKKDAGQFSGFDFYSGATRYGYIISFPDESIHFTNISDEGLVLHQNGGISINGITSPNASTALDIQGTTKAIKLGTATRASIATPANGMLTDDTNVPYFYDGSNWTPIATRIISNATDADFTATANGVHNILDGVASANRVITIPTGSNGDVMKFYNTEDTRVWSFTGATVYLADRVTVVTELLYNVPCHMERIDGRWIITN